MLELLTLALFVWLFYHALRLTFRITWGFAKVVAVFLLILALPVLAGCLLFASGVILLLPIVLVVLAWSILRAY